MPNTHIKSFKPFKSLILLVAAAERLIRGKLTSWIGDRARIAITAAAAAAAAFAIPAVAEASADGCVWSEIPPRSCVQVKGASTYVDWARGGVNLLPRQSVRGYFEVFDRNHKHIRWAISGVKTYWNKSFVHSTTFWGDLQDVKKDLPNNIDLCAEFVEQKGDKRVRHSPACIHVKS